MFESVSCRLKIDAAVPLVFPINLPMADTPIDVLSLELYCKVVRTSG